MSSHNEFQLQIIDPTKDLYYTPQNHSTVTSKKYCLLVSDEGIQP